MSCDCASESCIRSADTKVVFFSVAMGKSLFIEEADCVEDCSLDCQAKSVDQRDSEEDAISLEFYQLGHVTNVVALGEAVDGPVSLAVEAIGERLPACCVG